MVYWTSSDSSTLLYKIALSLTVALLYVLSLGIISSVSFPFEILIPFDASTLSGKVTSTGLPAGLKTVLPSSESLTRFKLTGK